ncbi:MAG TPA: ABC transporter ATP-binding protein [Candidatus Saccharimonadales bacterium]|nr:ABC transporter ATP-binding protein [Candidatus Saccharimonadales bacterium]
MQQAAIEARDLSVTKGHTRALDIVSFRIEKGKVTGVIGPSGSGKTTLMRTVIGVQMPTNGSLKILGLHVGDPALRSKIGYQPQSPAVYGDLTTRQNVEYFAKIFGLGKAEVDAVLKQVDLTPQTNQLTSSLSGGQLARVSLAVALLGNAELLVLDEPTVGLDPVLRERLWALFNDLARQGRTLVISSHVMDEAERCQDILLLRDGKVLNSGAKIDLLQKSSTQSVEAAFLKLAGGSA